MSRDLRKEKIMNTKIINVMATALLCCSTALAKTIVPYPEVEDLPYTGQPQEVEVPESEDYSVIMVTQGTSVGGYDIYLMLTDTSSTKWPDSDDELGVIKWYVTKAENEWTTDPSISSWTYGESAAIPEATSKFGVPTVKFSGTARDGTIYEDVASVVKAGKYTCSFSVIGTDNYDGLPPVEKDFEIKVANPGGGGGGSGNVSINVIGYDGPYDGQDHAIDVSITGDDADSFSVTYSDNPEGPFGSENSYKYKEVGDHEVWYCLESDNYSTTTNSAVVSICRRKIAIPEIATKWYDGTVQQADVSESADYEVEYNGFFKEAGVHEGAVVLALKDRVHSEWVGDCEDPAVLSFEILKSEGNVWTTEPSISGWKYGESAHIPMAEAKFGVVSVLYDGATTDGVIIQDATSVYKAGVYKAKFTVAESASYNGLSAEVEFTVERGEIDIGSGGSGGARLDVSNYSGLYDGIGHTASIEIAGDASSTFNISYSLSEYGPFCLSKCLFTNACDETRVWYSISSPDYQTITNSATVAIAKRKVTLTSASVSKKFDGKPLVANSVTETGDGWVNGEGATYLVTGSQTNVGISDNVFTYTLISGTLESNYAIQKEEGILEVLAPDKVNPFGPDPYSPLTDEELAKVNCIVTYDGQGHSIDVIGHLNSAIIEDNPVVTYSLEADGRFDETNPVFTNVVTTSVWYCIETDNYVTFITNALVTISPRNVTLTSGSGAKMFDGSALKNPEVNVSSMGWAEGEGATYNVTGSRTAAGTSVNTFTYTLNDGTIESNYVITKVEGSLTVYSPYVGDKLIKIRSEWNDYGVDNSGIILTCDVLTNGAVYAHLVLDEENCWSADIGGPMYAGSELIDYQLDVYESRCVSTKVSRYGLKQLKDVYIGGRVVTKQGYRVLSGMISAIRDSTIVLSEFLWDMVRYLPVESYVATDRMDEGVIFLLSNTVRPDLTVAAPQRTHTLSTPVPVPYEWLDDNINGSGDYDARACTLGKNGRPAWQSYLMGLNPNDADSDLKIMINLDEDGMPFVTWSPDLSNANPPRIYRVYGKEELDDAEWVQADENHGREFKFFKVEVELR